MLVCNENRDRMGDGVIDSKEKNVFGLFWAIYIFMLGAARLYLRNLTFFNIDDW